MRALYREVGPTATRGKPPRQAEVGAATEGLAAEAYAGRRVGDPAEFGRVAVLLGGRSAERAISLESGAAVLAALQRAGVDATGIDASQDTLNALRRGGFARVFVVLHGRGGEDGIMQGALEALGLPYTGSSVLGSALAMDKQRTKLLWQACGIPTPAFCLIEAPADLERAAVELGFPLVIKPVHEGSSIGMSKVQNHDDLLSAWELASRMDTKALAEQWIDGPEYTAAILCRQVLPLIEVQTPRAFYDYQAKYSNGAGTRYLVPCGLPSNQEQRLKEHAWAAFEAIGASGWGRVDLLCDVHGNPWFLEVNTVPGMTSHSLLPMAARAAGIEFDELVWRILETSLR